MTGAAGTGPRVRVAHTADLDAATLATAEALLAGTFGDSWSDDDWEHALGGVHALVWDGPVLVGHASVVQRRMLHRGRALRTGYVEAVAVRADRRGHGYGGALMAGIERVIGAAYDLGALCSSDAATGFYRRRGWLPWPGPTWALGPAGPVRTEEEDGAVYVLPVKVAVDPHESLTCDWRDGDLW